MNDEVYNKGLEALKARDYKGAMRDFQAVLNEMEEHDDGYNSVQSYLGLSQVLTLNRNGLLLCRDAASSETRDAEVFLNLASAEWHCGNRKRAIDAVRHGFKVDSDNERLKRALGLLQVRKKKPFFSFLSRRHPLNRIPGRFFRRQGSDLTVDQLLY